MKTFRCDHCGQPIYFENDRCLGCGHLLAYLPDVADMAALEPIEGTDGRYRSLAKASGDTVYRLCDNYTEHAVCNWTLRDDEPNALCRACRFTRVVPNLEAPGAVEGWRKLEIAKRRLIHSLIDLGLPLVDRNEDPEAGLAFDFLSDDADPEAPPVLTGHDNGVITINAAEADDVEREKRRVSLYEPYRTLLGHFRHEVGHYYWDRLIRDSDRLDAFRALFGDEREDYAEALKKHYATGAPPDWQERHVSPYSSAHPWEDWAETWAHYLHMVDTLQTADACGVTIFRPEPPPAPTATSGAPPRPAKTDPFDATTLRWIGLAVALNDLNRSLGLPDGYPFVLKPAALAKLRFVDETVRAARPMPEGPGKA